ncbi:MBL fold metallo-hydrolase [candidate division KSB1 bacterium]|nr:MBL fold metallo-hydrolase [candidate division KSB1 bacterium]
MRLYTTKAGSRITRILFGRCNVYLVQKNNTSLLIDSSRRAFRRRLIKNLSRMGIHRLDYLLLTHTHFDHAENAAFLQREFRARVIVHKSEADWLQRGDSPLPRGTLWPTRILTDLLASRLQLRLLYEPCTANFLVEQQQDLKTIGLSGKIISTPGHSRGSLCVIIDDEIALVGDTLFGIFPGSIFPPFADDKHALADSWSRLLTEPCRLYLPGHGWAITRKTLARKIPN